MSMISAKCDRLRDTATRVEIFLEGCTDAIPMDTHEQLRSAANIIWELRNKLAGTVDQRERIAELESEKAKLRELCKDIWNDALHFEGFWDYVYDDGTIYREDELPHYQERMRELGIEVK